MKKVSVLYRKSLMKEMLHEVRGSYLHLRKSLLRLYIFLCDFVSTFGRHKPLIIICINQNLE